MIKATSAALFAATVLLAGCANQTSIWRNESYAGNIAAMDAQQRVVISAHRTITRKIETPLEGGKTRTETETEAGSETCPEPSPDAIASFASSLGLGLSRIRPDSTTEASLRSALSTSVASVGLRTPTTQVIRDLITANCIAQMNRHFRDPAFKEAFARNQQFVLAAHAIAVIGGEIAAGQAGTAGKAGAAGLDPTPAFENLKAAVAARQAAEDSVVKLTAAKSAADGSLSVAKAALDKASAATPVVAADVAKAKDDHDKATKEVAARKEALDLGKSRVEDARTVEAAAAQASASTSSLSDAAASGAVSVGTISRPGQNLPGEKAVEQIGRIASALLTQGFTLDKCFSMLVSITKIEDSQSKEKLFAQTQDLCTFAITAEAYAEHTEKPDGAATAGPKGAAPAVTVITPGTRSETAQLSPAKPLPSSTLRLRKELSTMQERILLSK